MTATFLLLAAAASSLTASAVRTMTPAAAGEAVLAGREHGPIVAVAEEANPGLRPPGADRLELVERPTRVSGGCQRRRWIADFRAPPGGSTLAAVLEDVRPRVELLATPVPSCAATGYAQYQGVTAADAMRALTRLDQVRRAPPVAACRDQTGSGLCRGARELRRELTQLSPWMVSASPAGGVGIWMGTRGGTVTEVLLDAQAPGSVSIHRFVPAPA